MISCQFMIRDPTLIPRGSDGVGQVKAKRNRLGQDDKHKAHVLQLSSPSMAEIAN